jgi:hypothetical protein
LGVFDKIQFWKKEEPIADPGEAPSPYDLGVTHSDPLQHEDPFAQQHEAAPNFSTPAYPQGSTFPGRMQVPPQAQMQVPVDAAPDPSIHPRDIELILAKLDAIKSEMDALHQRVRKIEQATEPQKKYW